MPGKYQYDIELKSNVAKLLTDMKEVQDRLDTVEGKEYKIKLNVDEKKLSNVISNLEKMLGYLGKGTGDFKQFENLSKQLSSITTDINNISKAFSVMNDGSDFANSIKSIDTSLTALSNHFVSEMSGRMTSSIKEVKSTLSDIGDGGELAPLLQTINKIENAINELSTSVKGIGLNMNIDVGSDSEMEAKVQSKIVNALQAYQRLFDHIKMSSAGGQIITDKFFDFDINQYDTMMGKLQAYKKFIDNMRKEAKAQFNGQDVLYQDTEKGYWTQASAAMGQVTKAFNEMKSASDTNPLKDLFGSGDLSEVVSQLGLIVAKLEEISTTASSFKNVFANGFNITASVEEIDKLTNRVKELEDELAKIKLNPVNVDKSNISSENIVPIFDDSKEVSKIENIGDAIDGLLTDIKRLKHYTDEVFDSFDSNMFGSGIGENRLGNAAYFFDEKNMGDWKDIGEYSKYLTTWSANQVKLFDQTLGFTEEEIERIIKEFYSDLDDDMQDDYKFDLKNIMDDDLYEFRSKFGVELQDVMKSLGYDAIKSNSGEYAFYNTDKLIREVQVYDNEANKIIEVNNKVAQSIKETSSTASSTPPIKDVFQDNDKTTTDASTTAIKEESKALEQVSNSAKEASESKEKFANANKEVKASAETSSTSLNEEKIKIKEVGESADEVKSKLDDVIFKPNTDGFDEIVVKLNLAKDKIDEISKITKSSVWSESQGKYLESYNIKYKNGNSEIRGESSNKNGSNVLRANETAYDAKAAEQEAKAVKEVWDKNIKAIQDYMNAVTKLNNLNAKDKGTGKYASQIALQEKNVEELKEKALEARTAITSMINPHDVPLNTWRDYLDVMEKFSKASLGSAESVAKLEDALRQMDFSSLESAGTKFESQFKNLSIKPDGDHQFLSWTNDLKELNAKIDEYNSKVKYLKENNIVDGEQVEEVKKLRNEIEETINVMTKTPQAKRGWTDIGASKAAEKVANVLKQNTKMSKEAKDAIRAYYNELRSGNPSQPIDEILVKVNQLVQKERELGRVGKSFGEIFKEKVIYGGAAQLAGMVGFYDLINGLKQVASTVRELDTAYTEMRKVSDESAQSLKNFQKESFSIADSVGTTALAMQDATATWMRLGESLDQAKESAKDATILLNVSEFENIDAATDSLVAMSQAYKELDKMEIIDVLDKIGNEYSISTDQLSTALKDSAAVLKTQGNDLAESVALITAGKVITCIYRNIYNRMNLIAGNA